MLGGSSGGVGLRITYPGTTPCDRVHLGGLAFLTHFLKDAVMYPLQSPISCIHNSSLSNGNQALEFLGPPGTIFRAP